MSYRVPPATHATVRMSLATGAKGQTRTVEGGTSTALYMEVARAIRSYARQLGVAPQAVEYSTTYFSL